MVNPADGQNDSGWAASRRRPAHSYDIARAELSFRAPKAMLWTAESYALDGPKLCFANSLIIKWVSGMFAAWMREWNYVHAK